MKKCVVCKEVYGGDAWTCPKCRHSPECVDGFMLFSRELAQLESNIDPVHFEKVAEIEPENFWYRSRNRLIIWALRRYFANVSRFLEIGCGSGYVLSGVENGVPGAALYGSDLSIAGLGFAKKRLASATLFQMDARNIPYSEEFDVIGAFDVLEHIEEDELVLSQMYSAVRPGGGIVLTVPQHAFLWGPMDEYSCHVRRYDSGNLKRMVERIGFKVVRCTSFISSLFPLMVLSRIFDRTKIDEKSDLPRGLRLNRPLNYLLERVLSAETAVLRAGVNLPVGGSLLLVAAKERAT